MAEPLRLCAACGERPTRGLGQGYCRPCASAKDKASARARRAELKALREEIKALRARIRARGSERGAPKEPATGKGPVAIKAERVESLDGT